MSALTIPPEVAAECAKKLFSLAAAANRDAMTLIKQAMALARNEEPARPLGVLRKYVREHNQYGSGEVSEVIVSIETAAGPEQVKRLARYQAKRDAERAELKKPRSESERPPTYWEVMEAREEAAEPRQNGNETRRDALKCIEAYINSELRATPAKSKKSKRRESGNVIYL